MCKIRTMMDIENLLDRNAMTQWMVIRDYEKGDAHCEFCEDGALADQVAKNWKIMGGAAKIIKVGISRI